MAAAPTEPKMPARPLSMASLFDEIDARRIDNKPYIAKGYKIRMEVFLDMIKQGSPFRDADNYDETFTLKISDKDAKAINEAVREFNASYFDRNVDYNEKKEIKKNVTKPLRDIEFTKPNGLKIKVSSIYKTKAFGGTEKLESAGKDYEFKTIEQLNNIIKKSINKYEKYYKDKPNYIKVRVGTKIHKVSQCVETGGTVKSDFHLLDQFGKPVIFISYKESDSPSKVQQWGGLSEAPMPSFKQTQDFVAKVKKLYPKGMYKADAIAMKITGQDSIKLKNKAVFGIDWENGKREGINNVSFVAKGRLRLSQVSFNKNGPPLYEFEAPKFHLNGDTPSGETEPVFYARYDKRPSFGVGNSRIVVFPKGGLKAGTVWIDPNSTQSKPRLVNQTVDTTKKLIDKRKGKK